MFIGTNKTKPKLQSSVTLASQAVKTSFPRILGNG